MAIAIEQGWANFFVKEPNLSFAPLPRATPNNAYIYIYMYIYIYIYICIYAFIVHTYTYTCMHICTYKCASILNIHTFLHTVLVYVYACSYAYVQSYIHNLEFFFRSIISHFWLLPNRNLITWNWHVRKQTKMNSKYRTSGGMGQKTIRAGPKLGILKILGLCRIGLLSKSMWKKYCTS